MKQSAKKSIIPRPSNGGIITLFIVFFTILLDRFLNLFLDNIANVKWYQSRFLYLTIAISIPLYIYYEFLRVNDISSQLVIVTEKNQLQKKRYAIKVRKSELELQRLDVKYYERAGDIQILKETLNELQNPEYSYEQKYDLYKKYGRLKRGL